LSLEKAFGAALRAHRTKCNLTQLSLAQSSGLHITYISMLERGLKQPSLKAFLKISVALKVPPADLLKSTLKGLTSRK